MQFLYLEILLAIVFCHNGLHDESFIFLFSWKNC